MRICTRFWIYGYILIAICTLTGCKTTEYVPVPYPEYHTEWQHDSIDRHHYHTEYTKGDTLFVHDSVFVDRWNNRTVYDSIDRPYPVYMPPDTVYVEKPLSRWQKVQQRGFNWLLVVIAGGVFWKTRKFWLRKI